MKKEKIIVFDTTLRDGEQSPGAMMSRKQKLKIAGILDDMGVDVIEAGFAIASPGDFECVKAIAEVSKNSAVASLARSIRGDIEAAAEAIKPALRPRIHTFISTSPIQLDNQMMKTQDEAIEIIKSTVTLARNLCDDVEWSAMDATRTGLDFLTRAVEAAIKCGATTINIPDTVGFAIPQDFFSFAKKLIENVPNSDKVIFSAHCHNDLGLATANTLAALNAGFRQVECSINGLGERAGNAALEEVVMAIKTRNDILPYDVEHINTTLFIKASEAVEKASGFIVQKNKAIVGQNAFAHASGIHQDGMLKNRETYEIMIPKTVGRSDTDLVLSKHSGRAAFSKRILTFGYSLNTEQMKKAFEKFKLLGDSKKYISDTDLVDIMNSLENVHTRVLFIDRYRLLATTDDNLVLIELKASFNKKAITHIDKGNGPLDAIFKSINEISGIDADLNKYLVASKSKGFDAVAEVNIEISYKGKVYKGVAAHTDTLMSSTLAYTNAVNQILKEEDSSNG